jgi:hypothetical protein
VIDGPGSGIAAVEYVDMDGQGCLELILTYQVSEAVTQALQVYCYQEGTAVNMLTASCSQSSLWDGDSDGQPELLCFTTGGGDSPTQVDYYDATDNTLRHNSTLWLSYGYDSLRRVCQGQLLDGTQTVLASGITGDGDLMTEVLVSTDQGLQKVESQEGILRSSPADGNYVYPEDLDGDGALELPQTALLPGVATDDRLHWTVTWYSLDARGQSQAAAWTYENFDENWYLTLPETWSGQLLIHESVPSVAVQAVSFYRILPETEYIQDLEDTQSVQEILTVYTLRGTDRQSYVEEQGLTTLRSDSDVTYAVALNTEAQPWEGSITLAQVSEMFHSLRAGETDSP